MHTPHLALRGVSCPLPICSVNKWEPCAASIVSTRVRSASLEEGLLASPFSLTQARVLFELGTRKAVTAGEIGEVLGLDAGYLSRIVQHFVSQGLVERTPSNQDGRQWMLSLTNEGRKVFRVLDRASHQLTASVLSRLSEPQRGRLLASMKEVRACCLRTTTAALLRFARIASETSVGRSNDTVSFMPTNSD